MDLSFLNEKTTAIIMVVLGVLALAFPLVSTETVGIILGATVALLAVGLFISGIAEMGVSRVMGAISVVVAIVCVYFAYELIFDPVFLSKFISIVIYIIGFLLIVLGIFALLSGSFFAPFSIIGLTTIIFGVITVLVGVFLRNPSVLGSIIGIWLIVSGLLSLFSDKEKSYIDIHL